MTMLWTNIFELNLEEWLSKTTKKLGEQLNRKRESLIKAQDELISAAQQVETAPIEQETDATAIGKARMQLLTQEYLLRKEYSDFYRKMYEDNQSAYKTAEQFYRKQTQEIHDAIIAIGYPESVLGDFVARHPRVKGARIFVDGLHKYNLNDHIQANNAALNWLEKEIAGMRKQAMQLREIPATLRLCS